jgi:cell division protein FtsL
MAQTRNNVNHTVRKTTGSSVSRSMRSTAPYINDNTARKLNVQRQLEEAPARKLSRETRNNRERARHMNLGYLVFLMAALSICGVILVNYIQLQSDLTAKTRKVASLETQLNSMKLANDEEYNRINASVDLEEIKKVAIGELGMTYAQEGQIITYSYVGNDYMRKVSGD